MFNYFFFVRNKNRLPNLKRISTKPVLLKVHLFFKPTFPFLGSISSTPRRSDGTDKTASLAKAVARETKTRMFIGAHVQMRIARIIHHSLNEPLWADVIQLFCLPLPILFFCFCFLLLPPPFTKQGFSRKKIKEYYALPR